MKNFSKVNTFFVEIILVILFFSLASAVTVTFFASAHKTAALSEESNLASLKAQSVMERFKAGELDQDLTISYDGSWNLLEDGTENGVYLLTLRTKSVPSASGELRYADVTVSKSEQSDEKPSGQTKVLCSYETGKYLPS